MMPLLRSARWAWAGMKTPKIQRHCLRSRVIEQERRAMRGGLMVVVLTADRAAAAEWRSLQGAVKPRQANLEGEERRNS